MNYVLIMANGHDLTIDEASFKTIKQAFAYSGGERLVLVSGKSGDPAQELQVHVNIDQIAWIEVQPNRVHAVEYFAEQRRQNMVDAGL